MLSSALSPKSSPLFPLSNHSTLSQNLLILNQVQMSSAIKSSDTNLPKKPPSFVPQMKPLMLLKDFMVDDLGSCSSNGFKSFPRCCSATSVRFILDRDLKKAKTASTAISALQRAFNAVRNMPFNATSSKRLRFPNSFSRRLSRRSFWNKSEIGRLRSLREYLEEKYQPSDSVTVTTDTTAVTVTTASNSNSNSWSGSEFTVDYLPSLSGHSEVFAENDDVGAKKKSNKESMEGPNVKKEWPVEEKEQFSPVSVLDCPFDDEFDVSWPFRRHRPSQIQGENQKPLENIRRFDSIKLEPVNLEKKFISSESDDNNESINSPHEYVSTSTKKAEELVISIMKTKTPSTNNSKCKLRKVLLDFFKDRIEKKFDEKQMLKVAEDWLNGNGNQMLLDWQVEEGRKAYIIDMEDDKEWRNEDLEEKEEVGLDVEVGVWTCLVDELVLDLFFR